MKITSKVYLVRAGRNGEDEDFALEKTWLLSDLKKFRL